MYFIIYESATKRTKACLKAGLRLRLQDSLPPCEPPPISAMCTHACDPLMSFISHRRRPPYDTLQHTRSFFPSSSSLPSFCPVVVAAQINDPIRKRSGGYLSASPSPSRDHTSSGRHRQTHTSVSIYCVSACGEELCL